MNYPSDYHELKIKLRILEAAIAFMAPLSNNRSVEDKLAETFVVAEHFLQFATEGLVEED